LGIKNSRAVIFSLSEKSLLTGFVYYRDNPIYCTSTILDCTSTIY